MEKLFSENQLMNSKKYPIIRQNIVNHLKQARNKNYGLYRLKQTVYLFLQPLITLSFDLS
jgi:hypothetical protein